MENSAKLKNAVIEKYAAIANTSSNESVGCCDPASAESCCGSDISFADDYAQLKGYNPDADLKLGCGLPTEFAHISVGQTVLDLGAGAGNDGFVARTLTGETGQVIGIDITPAMVQKANNNVRKLGYSNIEFILGEIENMPLEASSVDVVISNCVLNLVPDKLQAFREIHRVLKPAGHFSISDIVIDGEMPDALRDDMSAYAGCISGALDKTAYLQIIEQAGFVNVTVQKSTSIPVPASLVEKHQLPAQPGFAMESITVYGEKV